MKKYANGQLSLLPQERIVDIDDFLRKNRQCYKVPSILPACPKIIAIGDLHGDFDALMISLKRAGIIDSQGSWVAGSTIVVQVGDVLDRGGRGSSVTSKDDLEELQILNFLYKLNRQALLCNPPGRVITLLGNHELMNMIGDFRFATKEHISGFGGFENRKNLFEPGGQMARRMACNSLGVVMIGDWVFVHGGLLPEHLHTVAKMSGGVSRPKVVLDRINNLVRGILRGKIKLENIGREEESILFGGDGIFWTRKYSQGNVSREICNDAYDTLSLLGIDRKKGGIVIGHTPQNSINSVCDNRIWRIDTGMSEAFGHRPGQHGRIEVLEILQNGESVGVIH